MCHHLLSQSMGCEEPLKMVLRSMVPTQSSLLKGIFMWMIACCLYHMKQKWSTYFNAHKPHLQSRTSAYTSPLTQVTAWHELSSSFPTRGLCSSQQWICYSGRSLRRHSPTQQWLILNSLLDKSSLLSTVFLNQLHKRSLVLFQTQRPCKAAPVWLWDQLYRSMQGARVFTFSATMTKVDSAMQKPSGWGPSSPLRKASHSQLLADGHGDCGIPWCGWFLEKGRGEDKWPRQCENLTKASCRRQAWLQLIVASCRPGGEYAAPEAFFYLFIFFYKFLLIIVSCLFSL